MAPSVPPLQPVTPQPVAQQLVAEHLQSNASALPHYETFAPHRQHLTAFTTAAAPAGNGGALCVLGAGNCYDLDLGQLTTHYAEVHLVDIDGAALRRAVSREAPTVQRRLTCHAAVDLSGAYDRLDRWARLEVTPEELMGHAARAANEIRSRLGRSFEVVLSACMLSQMQLSLLHALGDRHPLFEAARWTVNLTHLRTLAELTSRGGKALFVTDATSGQLFPFADPLQGVEALSTLSAATDAGAVFDFADPHRLESLLTDDPSLRAAFPRWSFRDGWVWRNGPETQFLVYACELPRA